MAQHRPPLEANPAPVSPLQEGEILKTQDKRCTVPAFESLPPCLACYANKPGEHCRFRKSRLVALGPAGTVRSLQSFTSGSGFRLVDHDGGLIKPADKRDDKGDARHVLQYACSSFLEALKSEQGMLPEGASLTIATSQLAIGSADPTSETRAACEHTNAPGEKQLCDGCNTTIFCYYATCPNCGFEACMACTDAWRCDGKAAHVECPHPIESWAYFSRFATKDLADLQQAAAAWCAADGGRATVDKDATSSPAAASAPVCSSPRRSPAYSGIGRSDSSRRAQARHPQPLRLRLDGAHDEERFLAIWSKGEPIVGEGVGERLHEKWTPDHLSSLLGEWQVPLIEVRSGRVFQRPLKDFLNGFRHPEQRPQPPETPHPKRSRKPTGAKAAGSFPVAERAKPDTGDGSGDHGASVDASVDASVHASPSASPSASAVGIAPRGARTLPPGGGAAPWRCVDPSEALLKLKDWPTSSDFAELLPEHFADLMRALPLAAYTKRDGALNLASKRPRYCLPPDLGPKMYLGFGALTPDGRFVRASTSERHAAGTGLHVDIADAVNILCHIEPLLAPRSGAGGLGGLVGTEDDDGAQGAAACGPSKGVEGTKAECSQGVAGEEEGKDAEDEDAEDKEELQWLLGEGQTGGAVWDIWHADDAETICAFLNRVAAEKGLPMPAHPIHDQTFYINARLRKRLKEEGVVGWRFVQRLGDAVFIPCGCPHQVLNLRSCIKVAMDFVSPEHIARCLAHTEQFRLLPRGHGRRQDTLSTKSVLLHTVAHALRTAGVYVAPGYALGPPPTLVGGEVEYSVEYIAAERMKGSKLEYNVKWLGYDEWTWEPARHLKNTKALLEWQAKKQQNLTVPEGWVWPVEGEGVEVEVAVSEDTPPAWVTAEVLVVLVDGTFQARIVLPDGSDQWDDWFSWKEEGKDWRRRAQPPTAEGAASCLASESTHSKATHADSSSKGVPTTTSYSQQSHIHSNGVPTTTSQERTEDPGLDQGGGPPVPGAPPPPAGWKWLHEGETIEVEVAASEGAPAAWVTAEVLVVLVDGTFQARIVLPDGSDQWEDWFSWKEEGMDWRRRAQQPSAAPSSGAVLSPIKKQRLGSDDQLDSIGSCGEKAME